MLDQWLGQLNERDAAKHRQTIPALGSFGPDLTEPMIQRLGAALSNSDPAVRHPVTPSLTNFGPLSKAPSPEI
jgi:hypothetical protein